MSAQSRTRATLVAMLALALARAAAAAGAGGGGVVQDRRHRRRVLRHQERRHPVVVGRQRQRRSRRRATGSRRSIPVQVGSAATWTSVVRVPGQRHDRPPVRRLALALGSPGIRHSPTLVQRRCPAGPGPWQQVGGRRAATSCCCSRRAASSGPSATTSRASSATARPPARARTPGTSARDLWLSVAAGEDHSLGVQERRHALGVGRQRERPARHRRHRRPDAHVADSRSAAPPTGPPCSPAGTARTRSRPTAQLYAWGGNDYGQLGIGSSGTDRLTPKALAGVAGPTSLPARCTAGDRRPTARSGAAATTTTASSGSTPSTTCST